MKTRTKVFHAAAILASSLINMHVFVSVAAQAHVLYSIAFGLSLWYVSRFADVKIGAIKDVFGGPANYREPNWQDHIAKRGEMPQWLKKALP